MQPLHKKYKNNQEVVWLSKQTLSMHHASTKSFHANDRDVADRMLESESGTKPLHLDNCSHLYLCTYGWYETSNLLSSFLILSLQTHDVECVQGIYDGCTKSAKLIITSFWLRLRKHKLPQLASREGTFPESLPQNREGIPNISERGLYLEKATLRWRRGAKRNSTISSSNPQAYFS